MFYQEPVPPRGVLIPALPGIARIVADNPSPMTYNGTNTWIIEYGNEVNLIDPGPDDDAHLQDVLNIIGRRKLRHIILTHTHSDHSGNAKALQNATGAPIVAYKHPFNIKLLPDTVLNDGDTIDGLTAIYTPGHAADHLCFQYRALKDHKILFSGDHVMSWSSSIVNPPDGDMRDYYRSLELVMQRDDDVYLCGHGPLLPNPHDLAAELLSHRQFRERTILAELEKQDWAVAPLAAKLYHKDNIFLKGAAQRNVLAHLLKLIADGVVEEHDPETTPHEDVLSLAGVKNVEADMTVTSFYRDSLRRFGMRK